MGLVQTLYRVGRDLKRVQPADQIVGDAGAMTVTPTGGSSGTLPNVLGALAPLASPVFTGTPVAPTPSAGDSSTKLATTAFAAAAAATAIPAGAVASFAMSVNPTGWLKANGAAVSRTAYAALYAAIGVTYGAGDGSTTFNLPDLRGQFLRGFDDGRGVDPGRALGSAQADAFRSHNHPFGGNYSLNGPNDNNVYVTTASGGSANQLVLGSGGGVYVGIGNRGDNETRPLNIALLACIKY